MNEKEPLRDLIRRRIALQLELPEEEICDDLPIVDSLGADSMDVVELLTAMEDHFSVSVPDEAVLQLRTIEDVLAFLSAKGITAPI